MFLNRQKAIPITQVPTVSRNRTQPAIESSSRNILGSGTSVQLPFRSLDVTSTSFPKFNATGRSLLIKFNSPVEEQEPTAYIRECITSLTNYLFNEVSGRYLVGLRIRNTENVQDKVVGNSLRRCDHLGPDVAWDVLGKIIQSNARFNLTDRLKVHLDHVRMPAGNGTAKTKGRPKDVLGDVKKSIVVVKTAFLCLAHALIIAMARVNGDPKYQLHRRGNKLDQPVDELLKASGVYLSTGGGLEELKQFQDYLSDYKIIVYVELSPDRIIFTGNSVSNKKFYLLYIADTDHYSAITNIKAAMVKKYICNACDTLYDNKHKSDKSCSLCTATPPWSKNQNRCCGTCNRSLLSEKYFQNHLTLRVKGKLVCQWRQVCRNCNFSATTDFKHECIKHKDTVLIGFDIPVRRSFLITSTQKQVKRFSENLVL